MAKFEDYAKKDELEEEIQSAAEGSETREGESSFQMPERFTGKTPEEIAQSYVELENMSSRQAQDLGSMRKTVDELFALQSKEVVEAPAQPEPITVDDLYEDPQAAIERGVEAATGGKIAALEQELANAKLQTRVSELDSNYKGWRDTVQTPEFATWVQERPYRARLAQKADGWDLDAAEELLDMFSDAKGVQSAAAEAQRNVDLQNAGLESGAAAVQAGEQSFKRVDLMNTRIAANQGDREAIQYLKDNAEAIAIAYESGNITD